MARNVVAIILYNSENKVLLQLRTNDAPTNPSKWCFFGGGMEEGEDKLKSVMRETLEELDYELKNPKLVYEGDHPDQGKIYVYAEKYEPLQKLDLREGKAFDWFSIQESKEIDLIPYMREILFSIKDNLFK